MLNAELTSRPLSRGLSRSQHTRVEPRPSELLERLSRALELLSEIGRGDSVRLPCDRSGKSDIDVAVLLTSEARKTDRAQPYRRRFAALGREVAADRVDAVII